MKVYGWDSVKLSNAYSLAELVELRKIVESDPANHNRDGSIWLFTPKARKKLDAIAWAVRHVMSERRHAD